MASQAIIASQTRLKSSRSNKSVTRRKPDRSSQEDSAPEIHFEDFESYFSFLWHGNMVVPAPLIKSMSIGEYRSEPNLDSFLSAYDRKAEDMHVPTIYAYKDRDLLIKLVCKDLKTSSNVIDIFEMVLEHQVALESLKFDNCNLESKTFEKLQVILEKNSSITELFIDKNPVCDQSFFTILEGPNNLASITFRLCKINDSGIKEITRTLLKFGSKLTVINLSSNSITDEGVLDLMKYFRVNRTVASLNLSNNLISNTGCMYIGQMMEKFVLEQDENVVRRRRIYGRLRRKQALIKEYYQITPETATSDKASDKKSRVQSAGNSRGRNRIASKDLAILKAAEADAYAERRLDEEIHPFVIHTFRADKRVYCYGNFHLGHLNLSYNKISEKGIKYLADVMNYQYENAVLLKSTGLLYLNVYGNFLYEPSENLLRITDILYAKTQVKLDQKVPPKK